MRLLTTLAVQKCALVPVVKNSAPTVGTPLNFTGVGMPGGAAAGPPRMGWAGYILCWRV